MPTVRHPFFERRLAELGHHLELRCELALVEVEEHERAVVKHDHPAGGEQLGALPQSTRKIRATISSFFLALNDVLVQFAPDWGHCLVRIE